MEKNNPDNLNNFFSLIKEEKKKKDEEKKELIGEISFETMFQDMAVETARLKKEITENNQIVFKYCSKDGNINETYNPNGSISNIAGILSLNKRILGMMPHPERYTDMKQKDIIMKQMIGSML